MKKALTILPASLLLLASCNKMGVENQTASNSNLSPTEAHAVSGIRTAMSAYYDSTIFKIQIAEFSPQAEASHIAHDKNINFIYQSDNGLPNKQPFISVIDAIPGDGFNPIWREVQIMFNTGITPRQLYSDNEVLALAYGANPEITLDTTNEVYWCPVIGKP
jgi:hypothetical protein